MRRVHSLKDHRVKVEVGKTYLFDARLGQNTNGLLNSGTRVLLNNACTGMLEPTPPCGWLLVIGLDTRENPTHAMMTFMYDNGLYYETVALMETSLYDVMKGE